MSDINLSVGLNTGGAAKKADTVARSLNDLGDSTTDARLQLAVLTKKLSTLSGALNTFKTGNFVNVMKKIQQHSFNSASSVALLTAQLISAEAVLNRFRANLGAPIQPTAPAAPAAPRQMSASQAEKLATALDRLAVSGTKAADGVQTLNNRVGGFVKILTKYRTELSNIAAANAQVRAVAAGTAGAIVAPTANIERAMNAIRRQLRDLRDQQDRASGGAGRYGDRLDDVTRASNRAAGANRNHNAILSDQVGFWRFAGKFSRFIQ